MEEGVGVGRGGEAEPPPSPIRFNTTFKYSTKLFRYSTKLFIIMDINIVDNAKFRQKFSFCTIGKSNSIKMKLFLRVSAIGH